MRAFVSLSLTGGTVLRYPIVISEVCLRDNSGDAEIAGQKYAELTVKAYNIFMVENGRQANYGPRISEMDDWEMTD